MNHHSESIKCRCRHRECQWEHKGRTCFSESTFKDSYLEFGLSNQGGTDNEGGDEGTEHDDDIRKVFKSKSERLLAICCDKLSNEIDLKTFSSGTIEDKLGQFMRDMNLNNSGQMNFNLNISIL